MPVSDTLDIDVEAGELSLDQLDKLAAKAEKSLAKERKELEKAQRAQTKAQNTRGSAGGAFPGAKIPRGGNAPTGTTPISAADLKLRKAQEKEEARQERAFKREQRKATRAQERADAKIDRKLARLKKKIEKDRVKQFGKKDASLLKKVLGDRSFNTIFNMGKNPRGFMMGIMKGLPILGGILAAKQIVDFIGDEIIKLDRIFKKFLDVAEDRQSLIRSREEQALISAGIEQRIITTAAGGADPREAYNTFEIFDRNEALLEANFAKSNTSGVD